MSRKLPPITEPVTRAEVWNLFLRELFSIKKRISPDELRKMLEAIGLDYDTKVAAADAMTDEEMTELIRQGT